MDFNFVTGRIAVGNAIVNESDVKQLINAGITNIVNVASQLDDESLLQPHLARGEMFYLNNGTTDDGSEKPTSWFQKPIVFTLAALAEPYRKVYIHCQQGLHRGPSMTYAVLLAWGLNMNDAENLIRTARPGINLVYKSSAISAVQELGYMEKVSGSAFGEVE